MAISENELVDRIQYRSSDALVMYLERQKPALLSVISRRLGTDLRKRIEPEDVFQELVLSAISALAKDDTPPLDPFAWLAHMAGQRVIDLARHHRAEKRDVRREIPAQQPASGPADSNADFIAMLSACLTSANLKAMRGERQSRLSRCLAELPDETRNILALRYGDGLPTKEIAQRLGKTDVSIRALVSHAVQHLQSLLAD